jgi:hypothetical protein
VLLIELKQCSAWLSTTLVAAFLAAAVAQTPPPHIAIVDLLRDLISTGVDVVYSSDLVPSGLVAPSALSGSDPMSRAVQALAAHHLVLRSISPGHFLVTRATEESATASAKPGEAGLKEISVFASRYAFTSGTDGEPIEFDRRRMDEVPGAQADAVQALRGTPGLATNLSARPYVRGAMLDDVLVQYDGIPLTDPFHFKSFQNLLSAFDPESVARGDLYAGGFPVRFGTRSGGVLDLAARTIESGSEVGVGASLLSYNLETVGHADERSIDWLLTARHSTDHSVLQPIEGEYGEPTFSDAVGRVRLQIGLHSALTLGGLLLNDDVHLSSLAGNERATAVSRDQSGWLGWDWTPNDALQSHSSVAIANSELRRYGNLALPGVAVGLLDEDRHLINLNLGSNWVYTASPGLTYDFGGAFSLESAELGFSRQETLSDQAAASFGRSADATISSNQAPQFSSIGLFGSVHRHWHALEAEAGLRWDAQDYHDFGTRSQLSPRLNVRYDATRFWHLYGSWGQFTQAQRVDEYRSEVNQSTPDPATRAAHLIAGITHESAHALLWRVEAYHDQWGTLSPYFDNSLGPVSLLPELEPDRVLVAPTSAEAEGVEFSAQRSFGRHFDGWGSFSLSNVTDNVNRQVIPRSWDQRQAASLGLAWAVARTSASVQLGWHSGWPQTPLTIIPGTASAPESLVVGTRNSARWGAYFSADVRLSRTTPLRYGELALWLDATNITNRANHCCIDLNASSAQGTSMATTDNLWSRRAINVGFTWRLRRPR